MSYDESAVTGQHKILRDEGIQGFNCARTLFGDPVERWNDWLALQGKPILEQYLAGDLAVLVDVDISVSGRHEVNNPSLDIETAINELHSVHLRINAVPASDFDKRNQELMFIRNIQIVEGPQGIIPSLVGLHGIDNKLLGRGRVLYRSTRNAGYKLFQCVENREFSVLANSPSDFNDKTVVSNVKCAPEIMQSVANHQRHVWRDFATDFNAASALSGFRVFFENDSVMIGIIEECRNKSVQIQDVLLGPINL